MDEHQRDERSDRVESRVAQVVCDHVSGHHELARQLALDELRDLSWSILSDKHSLDETDEGEESSQD